MTTSRLQLSQPSWPTDLRSKRLITTIRLALFGIEARRLIYQVSR